MIEPEAEVSVRRQCELLRVNRAGLYYEPKARSDEELELMKRIDALHLKHPFYGSRKITQALKAEGREVDRKRVQRLMRLMDLTALVPKPNTSKPTPEHRVFPYLLRNLTVLRVDQVWAADITYIPLAHGFAYLVAIMNLYSRHLLSWRLSTTLESDFCVRALEEALSRHGTPDIFNTDQGSQFTVDAFTDVLLERGVKVSMDGHPDSRMEHVFRPGAPAHPRGTATRTGSAAPPPHRRTCRSRRRRRAPSRC